MEADTDESVSIWNVLKSGPLSRNRLPTGNNRSQQDNRQSLERSRARCLRVHLSFFDQREAATQGGRQGTGGKGLNGMSLAKELERFHRLVTRGR